MEALLRHPALWRGDRLASPSLSGISTGFAELDAVLPGGGWPQDGLSELLPARAGIGELSLIAPALARLSQQDERWLIWITAPNSPRLPYAPALAAAGIRLPRLILVRPRNLKEALWAAKQALDSKSSSAVLAWLDKAAATDLRRLQLAAAGAESLALVFRPPTAAREASPAQLRLALDAPQVRQLAVRVLKRRGAPLEKTLHLDLAVAGHDHVLDRHPPARTRPAGVPARLDIA